MKLFLRKHKNSVFLISIYLILICALLTRIYNLPERINLGSDHSRDAIIAMEALKRHELPLIGSFASAGPFVFGPLYYWYVMCAYILMPFTHKAPWILMTLMGVLTVAVMMRSGYLIGGRRLCVIIGLLTAFAPQFIARSTFLSQHSLVGITSALTVLFFILLYQRKKIYYSFLTGLSLGAALSMHYQAINLLIFLPAIFLIPQINIKKKIIHALLFLLGVLIPSLPLLYWDSKQGFANINNVLDYIFVAQYRIYVPNSWKLYLFKYLPDYWSNVVGGNKPVALVIMLTTFFVFLYQTFKRKIQGEIFLLGSIFGILLLVIRYYRGERFDGYMIYVAPFIFLLSGWALLTLYDSISNSKYVKNSSKRFKNNLNVVALLIFFGILCFDFKNASQFIFMKSLHEDNMFVAKNALIKKFPNESFQLYDYRWKSSDHSYYLGILLNRDKKLSRNGLPLGVVPANYSVGKIIYNDGNWTVQDLSHLDPKLLIRPVWSPVNPPDVYDDLMKWQKTEKLTSTFSFPKYLQEKIAR